MSEISMYEAQKKKLQGLCDEHDLVFRFIKDRYPITLTIKPVQGMDAQLSMLENVEEVGYRSPDASMMWIFEDGVLETKVTGGTFTISKTLRGKIENVLVKMIAYWQQYFFRDVMEKNALRAGLMPVIDEDEADDGEDQSVLEGAEPLEEYEDDGEIPGEEEPINADDPEIQEATRIVRCENKASVSLLQRRMNIGYAKAARILDALEELDRKSRDAFERFKSEDLEKLSREAAELEAQCREQGTDTGTQADQLRQEIQALTSDLEYGTLSQEEYDRMICCREELHQCEADLNAMQGAVDRNLPDFDQQIKAAEETIKEIERKISNAVLYVSNGRR